VAPAQVELIDGAQRHRDRRALVPSCTAQKQRVAAEANNQSLVPAQWWNAGAHTNEASRPQTSLALADLEALADGTSGDLRVRITWDERADTADDGHEDSTDMHGVSSRVLNTR
jgi:hypothetical protein